MSEENTESTESTESTTSAEPTYEEKHEIKARAGGWKPLEDWEGESDDWVDARDFNTRGEYITKIKDQNNQLANVEDRISNLNQMHNAQMNSQRIELMQKRDILIEGGDSAGVKAIEQQINTLAAVPVQAPVDRTVEQWNANNPWILEDTPKAAYAMTVYHRNLAKGPAAALSLVNQEMEKHYPDKKQSAPMAEGGSAPKGNKERTKALTMNDVTPEELKMKKFFPHFKDDKKFLQAVTDSRKT